MKKMLVLICALFIIGCQKQEKMKVDPIAFLHYDDIVLADEQLLEVRGLINEIELSNTVIDDNFKHYIYIITNNKILEMFVSNNNYMFYIDNGIRYYSQDVKHITALMTYLQNMQETYTNNTFYTIDSDNTYVNKGTDNYIEMHKSKYYIVINSQINLFNFKIYEYSVINSEMKDIKELYTKDFMEKNKNIVIQINKPVSIANYRITFDTPYGYNVSIIPYYDTAKEEVQFTKTFKKNEA